jgi:DNA-binding MurR/RpiR family transcriptional regulator
MSQKSSVPHSQEAVIQQLLDGFDALPKQLQITARFIIDHPHEVGVQTMRRLASEAGVHPNSFVRLARHLGFDGYDALRERFRDFVRGGVGSHQERARWLQALAREGGASAVAGQMAEALIGNTEQLFHSSQVMEMEQTALAMTNSSRVFIVGMGSSYALAYNFWYLARMMFPHFNLVPCHGGLAKDELTDLSENDLMFVMTFQPYRTEIINLIEYAKQRKATSIGLTDSKASAVFRQADIGLYCPTHTPQFFQSNAAAIAMLETLCALLAAEGGDDVIDRIAGFNEMRWESGVYLD